MQAYLKQLEFLVFSQFSQQQEDCVWRRLVNHVASMETIQTNMKAEWTTLLQTGALENFTMAQTVHDDQVQEGLEEMRHMRERERDVFLNET